MRKRSLAREVALAVLYQYDLLGADVSQQAAHLVEVQSEGDREVMDYALRLVNGCLASLDEVDALIRSTAHNWDFSRMAAVDRNILRIGVYELLREPDVPPKVAIDEAIELAKKFSTQDSGAFVNGVIDKIRATVRPDTGAPVAPIETPAAEDPPASQSPGAVEADAEAESVLPSRRSSFAECVKALRGPADLHNHTTASDGDMDPAELVRAAAQAGVAALAVTDHDTVAGVREAMIAGESAGVLVIPGVELSCTNPNYADSGKREIHLVGLFIDWRDPELVGRLESLAAERIERARGIARKLDQVGVNIDAEAVIRSAQGVVGRMHIADALLDAGAVATRPQAFDRYIGEEAPAYLPKRFLSTREAIGIIHAAGGVAILAHPALSRADALIPGMVEEGLDGLEVYCPVHSPWEAMHYAELCRNHGLLASGGSDSHGTRKPDSPVGHTTVEAELVVKLFERSLLYGAGSAQRLNT